MLPLRAVPSGGALYPLELYVAALRVDGLEPGLYHFDPLRTRARDASDRARAGRGGRALDLSGDRVAAAPRCWSSRPSSGARASSTGCVAYRFALLEAGHVGQNVLLAATALGLGAVPLGGFYDRLTDEFLGLDGVNESDALHGRGREASADG